jgi:hypothetical protein
LEAALRRLARGSGPTVRKLLDEGRPILDAANAPAGWSREDVAPVVLAVIAALVEDEPNPRWRAAAGAALRLPRDRFAAPQFDSLASRQLERAKDLDNLRGLRSVQQEEAMRGYWTTAAPHLAAALASRLTAYAWDAAQRRDVITGPVVPPFGLPISFVSTQVLFRFEGHRGVQCRTQRLLLAHGDVGHYEAVGWYYSDPDAPVDIRPIANCTLDDPLEELPQGGRLGRLKFSRTLHAGETYYFEYATIFNSPERCRPTILYEVRGRRLDTLILRAQFDPSVLPTKCWHFDIAVQGEGTRIPEDGSPDLLAVASNGFVEKTFTDCAAGRKYGLRWVWPQ